MNEAERRNPEAELDEAAIAAYLEAHPDFFARHPDTLAVLDVAHDAGNAVSLIERQITELRQTNRDLQARFAELIETARDNEQRVGQLNRLAKIMIVSASTKTLMPALDRGLREHLDVDAVYIGLSGDAEAIAAAGDGEIASIAADSAAEKTLTNVYRRGKPICGPLSDAQASALFPERDEGAGALASAAMIPLGRHGVHGVLVLASQRPNRFVADMGTLFLELLGELVTAALQRLIGEQTLP